MKKKVAEPQHKRKKPKPQERPEPPTITPEAVLSNLCIELVGQVSRADHAGKKLPPAILKTSRQIEKVTKKCLALKRRAARGTPKAADITQDDMRAGFAAVRNW